MRKMTLSFVLLITLFTCQNLFAGISDLDNSRMEFGESYVVSNCVDKSDLFDLHNVEQLSQEYTYYNWHEFHTPKNRSVIELNLTNLDLGENSSLAVYDVFKSSIVWSTENLAQSPNVTSKFINLDTDSPYYVLVSSNEESIGSYVLELNIEAPNPVNDLCEGAIDLGNLTCGDFMYFEADPTATPDPEATGNCIDNTTPAQWYTFTTPDPLEFGSMYNNLLSDVELFSTTSGCDGLVYEDCYNASGTTNYGFDFEPGTTYYFLVSGDFFYSIPWDLDSSCDNPFWDGSWWWWWDDTIEFWSSTDCAEPSDILPCENDHVIWYEFTTDCVESDVTIEVDDEIYEDWWWSNGTAEEISITVVADDCATILSEYDVNGVGYVCSAMGSGEILSLENLPPNFTFLIAFGSANNNLGHFAVQMTNTNDGGEVENDICSDFEELQIGVNTDLSNLCATYNGAPFDAIIPGCPGQSEATVWYEFDPGAETQDITINLLSQGIVAPAIAAFDGCVGTVMESVCGNTLEITCVDQPILIEIGSSTVDAGGYDLEIDTSPSPPPLVPEIMGDNICSGEETNIVIDIPGGAFVDINVTIGAGSSPFVTGYSSQNFNSANSATINQELVNTSTTVQEVIYVVSLTTPLGLCATEEIEFSVLVNPGFNVMPLTVEECLPHELVLNVSDLISGGSPPYTSISWYWNGTELISSIENLSYDLLENGQILLEIIDSEGCAETAEINVELLDVITPTFDFPLSYCRPENDFILFPDISQEGVEGSWTTNLIDLSEFTENGFFDITFTPNEDYCSFPITVTFEIVEGEEPLFDLPDIICAEDDFFIFPEEDLNGVVGTWDNPFIDLSNAVGVQYNTFTPSSSQECMTEFEYIFEVGTDIELDFGQPDELCSSDAPVVLSNTSISGFEGTWDVSTIDPGLVVGDEFTATWTPFEGQSPCIVSTTITVSIVDPVEAEFLLPDEICSSGDLYVFPIMDNQEINGTWSIDTINPAELTGVVESIFITEDDCVLEYVWEIEIVEPEVPEFELETEFCELDEIFTLPTSSDNGIEGSWSQESIIPEMHIGEQLTLEFQSDQNGSCVESIEVTFTIVEAIDPIFDLPETICWEDANLVLPTMSDNLLEGSWDPELIDIQSNLGTTVSSVFSPEDGTCVNGITANFDIIAPYEVQEISTDPTGCIEEDGSIEIEIVQGDNLEFSIDNGLTWQSENIFSSLGSGGYTILIRSTDFEACELEIETFLNSNDGPVVTEVQSSDVSSCIVENGNILIEAEGNNLEFSIDNGLSWQISNEFTGLSPGSYMISVREAMSDCIVETSAEIADFPATDIMMVNTLDVSDCGMEDGQIEIVATGEALEYSIDDGVNWSSNNNFTGLPSDVYMIRVRSTVGDDCLDTDVVELANPDEPVLISWEAQNPTVCQPSTGSVMIEADGNNLEFSLDNGTSWQDGNIFTNLLAGDYQLIIREKDRINCFDEASVQIVNEMEILMESVIDVTTPSDCETEDGSLVISNSELNLEYSIDDGVSWQLDAEFINLGSGVYQVVTRKIFSPDCRVTQEVDIPEPDCPCAELILEFSKQNLSCSGDAVSTLELVSVNGISDPAFNILWEDGTEGQINEDVSSGWQYFMIEYDGFCEWSDSIYVEVLEPIQYEWTTKELDCPEAQNGTIEVVNVEGGNGTYSYALDGGNYQSENVFSNLDVGNYQIYVRDDTDCITINDFEIGSKEKLELSLPEILVIDEGELVILDPGVDASKVDYFVWTDGKGFENDSDLILQVQPEESTIFTIEVFYGECSESQKVSIDITDRVGIHMGNTFSPNGDGVNDHFFIQGGKNSAIELKGFIILDRWGNVMYNRSNPNFNELEDGWNGYYQGNRVTQGVYIYQISYLEDGQSKLFVGTVTVLD